MSTSQLAHTGGTPALTHPWPARGIWTDAERDAVVALLDHVVASGGDLGYHGDEENAYCRAFVALQGGGYADAVNSGTNAVYVALRALELEPYSEVICPPVTDPGGVMPVPLSLCIPIPADAAPGSYNAGANEIAARITPRTRAIIVAHIAGIPAEMDAIMDVAAKHHLPVIEDCAQAHGATYRQQPVGTFGTIAAFSTMFGKHHMTGGQGGVVYTRDEQLYWKIRQYADRGKPFGSPDSTTNIRCALNCNASELNACIGRVQLQRLPEMVACRRALAARIAQHCRTLNSVRLVTGPAHADASFWFLLFHLATDRVRVDKQTFVQALAAEGLPVEASYLHLFTTHDWYQRRSVFGTSGLPWSSPHYTGDREAVYPTPNIVATDATHFRMAFHERLDDETLDAICLAISKVDAAYAW